MSWPQDAYLYLRQIVTPKARPQPAGNLLYTKSDDKLYLMNASGVEVAAGDVTLNGTQTLTNKVLNTGTTVGSATTDISGAWTSYTPTLTNFTLGTGGTLIGKYVQIGKTVHVRIQIVGGTGAAATGILTISLPQTRAGADDEQVLSGHHNDGTATQRPCWGLLRSTGILVQSTSSGTWLSAWASGNTVQLQGTYEAA